MHRLRTLPRRPPTTLTHLYPHTRTRNVSSSSPSSSSSSSIYVIPINPSNATSAAKHLEIDKLLASIPQNPKTKNKTKPSKVGTTHIFYGGGGGVTALSSLGPTWTKHNSSSSGNEKRELVRTAVGSAVNAIKELGESVEGRVVKVDVSAEGVDAKDASVAAHLASYKFDLKTTSSSGGSRVKLEGEGRFKKFKFEPLYDVGAGEGEVEAMKKRWKEGEVYAEAQNLARTLMELPANMLTPTLFAERIQKEFSGLPQVEVVVRDAEWAKEKGMNSFLSVAKGSAEPPKFVEIHYQGSPTKTTPPLIFIGKGITFDSGGISLKPGAGMKLMRGDMGGAASVVCAALAIAKLQLPINLTVLTPLSENMPGPSASKPGDVIHAMNGTSIEIDNTDAEGRLVLADALWYATTVWEPECVVDVATLTGAIDIALGQIYTGVFTNSSTLWSELEQASLREHDLFWRMPLSEEYAFQIKGGVGADVCNVGGRKAGACTAALFLKGFVRGVDGVGEGEGEGEESAGEGNGEGGKEEKKERRKVRWAHLDMAGSMESTRKGAYQESGMTGRPTRALIAFAEEYGRGK